MTSSPVELSPREWVGEPVLEDEWVRIEPIQLHHYADLHPLTDEETFRYYVTGAPHDGSFEAFCTFVNTLRARPNIMPFVVWDRIQQRPAGMTSLMDIRPEARGVEIGLTWYGTQFRRTHVNPATKLLLLQYSFHTLGCLRVQLKCDARNEVSRAAILKLGAHFEGVLRCHGIQPHGTVRDTAMFSIVQSEWPAVQDILTARLSKLKIAWSHEIGTRN